MTFFETLRRTAEILTNGRNTEALYDYILHSMDDNGGFLRTRYVRSPNIKINDWNYSEEPRVILIAVNSPFDFGNSTDYYDTAFDPEAPENNPRPYTKLKMQIFYTVYGERTFSSEAHWSAIHGFSYPVKLDLVNGTAEFLKKIT